MDSVIGKIENVRVLKKGSFMRNGKQIPYTLFAAKINGDDYITFDKKVLELVGKEGEWQYEIETRVGSDGVERTSRKLILGDKKENEIKKIEQKLDLIVEKLEKIEELLSSNQENLVQDDFDSFLNETE